MLTIVPGAVVIWYVRNYIARGFLRSAGSQEATMENIALWPGRTAAFFVALVPCSPP